MKKKILDPVPCAICSSPVENKTTLNYCSNCKKIQPVVQYDLSNKRNKESDHDFEHRKEVYKSIYELAKLFKNKNIPKNYEIVSEYLKLKNHLMLNSEYKTILDKIEEASHTTAKPKSKYSCPNCGCSLSENSGLCDPCYALIHYGDI
jgi:uncharacterized Zn finger protein (UPF0148 family)